MGPLHNIKVIEFRGIGPAPMCAMLLADLGATVLRIGRQDNQRNGIERPLKYDLLQRGRPEIKLDLKNQSDVDVALDLISGADALIEGFRPGVMERLGLGPQQCMERNARLVYGRMTGWGQDGPLAHAAGHDLNYIALTGALASIGSKGGAPIVPLNLIGDFGGGSLFLAVGILSALIEARTSGKGQVVDAAIVDGTLSLMTQIFGMRAAGMWDAERGSNLIDGGAYFYGVYECKDGKWISVASIEKRFHAELLQRMGFEEADFADHFASAYCEDAKQRFAERFREKERADWIQLLEGSDVCFAPVLSLDEVQEHPHLLARKSFVHADGVSQPAVAPRFSRTVPREPALPMETSEVMKKDILRQWLSDHQYEKVLASGMVERM